MCKLLHMWLLHDTADALYCIAHRPLQLWSCSMMELSCWVAATVPHLTLFRIYAMHSLDIVHILRPLLVEVQDACRAALICMDGEIRSETLRQLQEHTSYASCPLADVEEGHEVIVGGLQIKEQLSGVVLVQLPARWHLVQLADPVLHLHFA